MAQKTKRRTRREWTKKDIRDIKGHSRARTPVAKMSKLMKRTGRFACAPLRLSNKLA
jgi:hypothetical protein